MVAEEVVVTLSGGAPWGFRLQGGAEHQMPLQVAKVRKRSKACRAGLRETDELVSINDVPCVTLSHAEAMNLIDTGRGNLHLRIKRAPAAFQSVVLLGRAPSPRIDKEYRAALRALSPPLTSNPPGINRASIMSPTGGLGCLTSPPDSEAYYGETDSDADVVAQEKQRRQRRRSPSSSPAKSPGQASPQEEDTSELSGYESAQDGSWAVPDMNGMVKQQHHPMPGVARREVVYQPSQPEWMHREENSSENSDQSPSGAAEVDSGFQEPPSVPPLVSPERARGALMLASHRQMVPMVGPVNKPVDEELSTTYMDKAKQAKLHRGESVQDKQVKEARSKCRTIASLLTDAPNPHSKGVLMFKKRRQRAKKYTLTSFGSADGESYSTTEGETEDESFFPGSESELDEDGFSAAPDPTWDSGYLDVLDRRTSAYIVPDRDAENSLGLNATSGKGAQLFEQQRKRAEEYTTNLVKPTELPISDYKGDTTLAYTPFSPVAPLTTIHSTNMVNGEPLVVSRTSVVLSSPGHTPMSSMSGALPEQADSSVASSVHNRTARPFAPGCVSHRSATAPVVFRPNTAKKAESHVKAVSVATIPASFSPASPEVKKAVSTTSLFIPARPATFNGSPSVIGPSSLLFPSSVTSGPLSPPPSSAPFYPSTYSNSSTHFSPTASHATSLNSPSGIVQPYSSSQTNAMPLSPLYHTMSAQYQSPPQVQIPTQPFYPAYTNGPPNAFPHASVPGPAPVHTYTPATTNVQSSPNHKVSFNPYISVASTTPEIPDTPISQQYQEGKSTDAMTSREQRVSVPAGRTGILQEARLRGNTKKPMFNTQEEKKPPSYNPELLSLVQNQDERSRSGAETGFESGPEEDFLNLGAEACNFMQAQKNRMPPPVAPKPGRPGPEIPQMQGKGGELFARRQNRMDRYVVDKQPKSPAQPRDPSPTPSLPAHWKYSPNIRAPPPINYNPLLSPSCPLVAQRSTKAQDASKAGFKTAPNQNKPGIKALEFVSRQPYQLNSSLFSYGGGTPQPTPSYQQQQNGVSMAGSSLNMPNQVPVKASRVYEIKRFSTPTPMSAPTALTPTVIVPRAATTLGEPMWRSDVVSPPPVAPRPMAPFSPPPPAPTAALPALPKMSSAMGPKSLPVQQTTSPMQAYNPFQAAKQFQSAPELSPLSAGLRSPGSSQNLRVPKPRFSTSSMGLQPKVWRPGSMLY